MKNIIACSALLFLLNIAFAQETTHRKWKQLFNGKDLKGWNIKIKGMITMIILVIHSGLKTGDESFLTITIILISNTVIFFTKNHSPIISLP